MISGSTLPQRPRQIIFVGSVGELCVADPTLVVLFFEATGFCPCEDARCVRFVQELMGPAIPGHFCLVFAHGTICHSYVSLPDIKNCTSGLIIVGEREGPARRSAIGSA